MALRILQGLAYGGEFGGAADLHPPNMPPPNGAASPPARSLSQRRAGLALAILVVLACERRSARRRSTAWGLAHSIPALRRAHAGLGLYPAAPAKLSGLPGHEAVGRRLADAATRGVRPLGPSARGAARPVRRRRRPVGRDRDRLLSDLPPGVEPEDRSLPAALHHPRLQRGLHRRDDPGGLAVGPNWPQAGGARRLHRYGARRLSGVPRRHPRCRTRASRRR